MKGTDERSKAAKLLARISPWVVSLVALALLVAHSLSWDGISVDGTSLGLLAVVLIASRWEDIRRLKIGDLEAEIGSAEVAQVQAEVVDQVGPPDEQDEFEATLELLRTDPTLGLAQVRIELERWLRSLHHMQGIGDQRSSRQTLGRLMNDLVNAGAVPPNLVSSLRAVLDLANRAIHGESIRPEDAETVGLLGLQLIDALREHYEDVVVEPIEVEVISPDEMERLRDRRLRVVTVSPTVPESKINTRILDQNGLDLLLEGYQTYAEFVISVELLEDDAE